MLPGIGNRVRRLRATRGRTMPDPAYQQDMATTCPPAAVIDSLFKTLLRVRQAEFEAQSGVYDPSAWDVVEEAKKRKRQEEEHGAEEPVWKLKLNAHKARKALREGRRLSTQIETGIIEWDSLPHDKQELIYHYNNRKAACPS